MKKMLTWILVASMMLGMILVPAGAATEELITVDTGWDGSAAIAPEGTGTENDPYLVSCPENLQWMSNLLNGKQYLATIGYNGALWHPTYSDGWDEIEAYTSGTTEFVVGDKTVNIDGVPKTVVVADMANAPKAYFKQTGDIDLNGKTLETIGAYWRYDGNGTGGVKGQWFGGNYDGQGYSIKNGYIGPRGTTSGYWNATGLFGNVWGATIENLTFDNVHVTGHVSMGMVAGNVINAGYFKNELDEETCFANAQTVIRNIQVKENCTVTHSAHANIATFTAYVGGLVGNATYNTLIERCRNGADISFGMYAFGVGGMTGRMVQNCQIDFCVNTGNLTPTGGTLPGQVAYGGIVGTWEWNGTAEYHGDNAVTNCINTGTLLKSAAAVTGNSGTVISYGGIVGRTFQLTSAADAEGNATSWTFENNINLGATPTLHESNSGYASPRAAAGVGSLWNSDSPYDPAKELTGTFVVLVAQNCYTVNTFSGLKYNALAPSDACPILSTRVYASSACGRAENCSALTADEIKALPLYQNIMGGVGTSSTTHKLLGVQTRTEANGTYTVRFLCGIDSLEYSKVSFMLMARLGDKQVGKTYTDNRVYTSFLINGEKVYASDYGYQYVTALTVKGLAADTEYTLGLIPSTIATAPAGVEGAVLKGAASAVTVKNDAVTFLDLSGHDVKIDGTDIGEFVIVLPQNASVAEQNLAATLQKHLQTTTGNKLNIVNDTTATAAHEIRVGNTARTTSQNLGEGQYAVIPSGGHLEITFADSIGLAELQEKLINTYFHADANNINLTLSGDKVVAQAYHPVYGTLSTAKIETADVTQYATRTLYTVDDTVGSKLKVLGRSSETSSGITMDWSAATLEFNANCEGAVKATLNTSRAIRFLVYVDNVLVKTLTTGTGTQTYTLAENLKAGTHAIRMVRTTKVEYSNVGALAEVQSLTLNGSLETKPANKKYLIEFIGDSVTTGVGAGSSTDPEAYAEHSFAYQTAMELGTDYSVVAIPGIGTLTSTGRHNGLHIYEAYQYTNYYRSTASKYAPTRQADLVVIGTNANDSNSADETTFKARVREIIAQAKAFHGTDTKFVWVFNMYNNRDTINGYVQEVFAEYGGEASGFYTVNFYVDNSGGDVHPSGAAHDDYTDTLVALIQNKGILN